MINSTSKKEEYAKAVCMFLGEMLRIHKISLTRAAEIAQKVVQNINLIDSERDFLRFVKELSIDFEELYQLEKIVLQDVKVSDRRQMEDTVREFVICNLASNTQQALDILVEAIKVDAKIENLMAKFPVFREFAETKSPR